MGDYQISILLTTWVLLIVLFVRNRLAFNARRRYLREIKALIDSNRPYEAFQYLRDLEEGPSYLEDCFDLTKWTYKQFFPKEVPK